MDDIIFEREDRGLMTFRRRNAINLGRPSGALNRSTRQHNMLDVVLEGASDKSSSDESSSVHDDSLADSQNQG